MLGLTVRREAPEAVDLDAATALVRLFPVSRVEHRAALRFQVHQVEASWAKVVAAGAVVICEPTRTPLQELMAVVRDPDGHQVTLWRPLTEDEHDFTTEVPRTGQWQPGTEALLQSLLKTVPALFRGLARRKVVREAEALSGAQGVDRQSVIKGFIRANSRPTRHRARQPLMDHGIDPEAYAEDFAW